MCSARRRSRSSATGCGSSPSGDYKDVADPTCAPFELVPCDVFITEATFGLPVFRHGDPDGEIGKLLHSVALFPERAHLVGAYSLGKAQRVIALIRKAGYDKPIYLHGAMEKITRYYESRGIDLGELRAVRDAKKAELAGAIALCPPSALQEVWSRRFPDPVSSFASGWMRVRARARQRGVELPLVISDHADWDGLTATIAATGASEIWVTHGQEDALVHWCTAARPEGAAARHRRLWRRGRERRRTDAWTARARRDAMNRFAELLDRLAYEPGRNNKLRLMTDYFRHTPDPERGYALAALTGALSFQYAKPDVIRTLIAERTDPVLFGLSYDYVGDLSETVALMWPADPAAATECHADACPTSSTTLSTLGKAQLPAQLARWLDALDETGRWALLKLVTGGLRIGVSARLAKTAAAALGDKDVQRDRAALARPRAALHRAVRLAGRPRREAVDAAIRRRSARRCWRMRSRRRISPRSTRRTSSPNGNGTASACRRSAGTHDGDARSAGSIRAPARTSPRAFPICSTRCASTARSTANC